MKKFFILFCMVFLTIQSSMAQATIVGSENFDGGLVSFNVAGTIGATWAADTNYYVSSPKSYLGNVPTSLGDSIVLTTPIYDFSSYEFVHLSFSQICKISACDIARVEYRLDALGFSGNWQPIPVSSYEGTGIYTLDGFNASSYSDWNASDSLAIPSSAWWKREQFDLTNQVGFDRAQFRFTIKRGNVVGTQFSYGWLLDNFELSASAFEIKPPTVEFISPFYRDTLYTTGPFVINAKVKSNTNARIHTPVLQYSITQNGLTTYDSITMTNVSGDSLWRATIGQYVYGTSVAYSITGRDTVGNNASINSGYYICRPPSGGMTGYAYAGDTTSSLSQSYAPFYTNYDYGWSRMLYLSSEISPSGGSITNIAFKVSTYGRAVAENNQACYMKAVNDGTISSTNYVDPSTDGATLVWSGNLPVQTAGTWMDIPLQTNFMLAPGQNLLVYWVNNDGAYSGVNTWISTSTSNLALGKYQDGSFPTTAGTYCNRPVARINLIGGAMDSNSVGLLAITSPDQLNINAGTSTPVSVVIKNKGLLPLTSAIVGWSLNGVFQNDTTWTGNLPEDFNDTLTIGNYFPTASGYDSIVVWVKTPNSVYDSTTYDDTLETSVYGCNGPLSGVYNVGPNSTYPTINDALFLLSTCGASGDVVFALESGTYNTSWDFSNFGQTIGNHTLTIRSQAMDADSVILLPSQSYGVLFSATSNLTISHITIDAATANKYYGVQYIGNCNNANVSHCKIYVDPTTTSSSYTGIYKASGGELTNCRINNNLIDGGYYNIYMYGGSANGRGNVRIDSNSLTNAYYYGQYTYYTNMIFHANSISSRVSNTSSYWYGLHSYYCSGEFTCNRIRTKKTFSYAYTMYVYYAGDSTNHVLIANNDIYAQTTSYYGVYLYSSYADIINNSIHAIGSSAKGLYISATTNQYYNIKNNNLVSVGASSYPIYISSVTYLNAPYTDIDYNNYYSNNYVGYAGGAKANLSAWKATVTTDLHSVNINPPYIDVTTNQQLSNYDGLDCPIIRNVTTDINGNQRIFSTAMGAYGKDLLSVDAALSEIIGWSPDSLAGTTSTIEVVIGNAGLDTLTSISIGWSFNGVTQPVVNWTGALAMGNSDTVTLGQITYIGGNNRIVTWINTVNSITDSCKTNDTLELEDYFCSSAFSGVVTVGSTGMFSSINEAFSIMNTCGVSGSITLELQPGTYVEYIDFASPLNGMTSSDTLTLTSSTGNRNDVCIQRSGDASVDIATVTIRTGNLVFRDLSITSYSTIATAYTYNKCVRFSAGCSNIEFDNCKLRAVTTFSSAVSNLQHIALINEGNTINNLRIHDCNISGSAYAIYFLGGSSSTVLFNNNVVDSSDLYGAYFTNTNFSSFRGNTAIQRVTSSVVPIDYGAFYFEAVNGDIVGNKAVLRKCLNGIYLSDFNAAGNGLVANNEIFAEGGKGILVNGGVNASVVHNSIRMGGNQTAYALYVGSSDDNLTIKNNNFITKTSTDDYPIYISSASSAAGYSIDYNNYYSQTGTYIGFVGANKTTMAALQGATTQDVHSVIVNPVFLLESESLKLMDSVGISCPPFSGVSTDMEGNNRGTLTTMGAYHYAQANIDMAVSKITNPIDVATAGTQTDVKVKLYNAGTTTLTTATINWSVNGVTQTPYTWTGSLVSRATSGDIIIGNFVPILGYNDVVAYISNPNGVADQNHSNDTATSQAYGCQSSMKGLYTVGASVNADFATMSDIITAMQICGIDSAVRIEIETGTTVNGLVMTSSIDGATAANNIFITSQSGIASDVVCVETYLGNISHVTFSKLTFNGTNEYRNIDIISSCDDIEFSDCILIGDTLHDNSGVAAVSALSIQTGAGTVTNFRILRNTIFGGVYGIYLYGTNGAYNDVEIADNAFGGVYSYGMYLYYTDAVIKNNTIISRNNSAATQFYNIYAYYSNIDVTNNEMSATSDNFSYHYGIYAYYSNMNIKNNKVYTDCGNLSYFYGIYTYYSNGDIDANTLWMRDTSNYAYGIYLSYFNNGKSSLGKVTNNELKLSMTGTYYGIYVSYALANISQNSIRMDGTGATRGIYVSVSANNTLIIKNNNIEMLQTSALPIYLSSSSSSYYGTGSGQMDIDYNNLVAPTYVGYAGGNKTTIAAWQTTVTTDDHSVSKQQYYVDSSLSLQVVNDTSYICPALSSVNSDKLGLPRYGNTVMGAYGSTPAALDAALVSFLRVPNSAVTGTIVTPDIVLANTGTGNLTSVVVNWTFNGVAQPSLNWTGNLSILGVDTLSADSIALVSGSNVLRAWLSSVNGTQDSIQQNDTLEISIFVCDSMLRGTYTVGSTGDLASITEVNKLLEYCGISGPVVFEFLPETHVGNLDLSIAIRGADSNSITLTKANMSNPNRAIIQPAFGTAIKLGTNGNIVIDSLTIDAATNASIAIQFVASCSNVSITNCNILARNASSSTYYAIHKGNSTGVLNNVLIRNNYISGGYYGVYLYGGSGSSLYGTDLVIDSNIITNQYYYANYFYYTNVVFANNEVSTTASSSTGWYGLCMWYTNPQIRNNKILSTQRTLSGGYAIYSYYSNTYNKQGDCHIINNEIRTKSTSSHYGMYLYYASNVYVLHNSIYLQATGAARGIYFGQTTSYNNLHVENNNIAIVGTTTTAIPIYLASAAYAVQPFAYLDYNNYYSASGIVGYASGNKSTLASLRAVTSQDVNSVIVNPSFVDSSINLALTDATGLLCFRHAKVSEDIEGVQREHVTPMGAYTMHLYTGVDLALTQIVEPVNSNSLCAPTYVSVKYAITNMGGVMVDFSQDTLQLTLQVTGVDTTTIDTIITSGTLNLFATDTFVVTDLFNVDFTGDYYLEASLSCTKDTIFDNNSLTGTYYTHKIGLPYDENFSTNDLTDLTVEALLGNDTWRVEQGGGIDTTIFPNYGTGKLVYRAPIGSISRLSTAQIELNRTAQPTLDFWYAHDSSNATANDQMDVKVTFDGGNTHYPLLNLHRYNATATTPRWTKYSIDLSPYVDSACAIIVFEAQSYGGTAQSIDRINISSNSNIALTDVLATDISSCNLSGRTLGVEITNQTGQAIDFSSHRTSVVVEVTGATTQSFTYPLINGSLAGLTADTLHITNNFDFAVGTYNVKAYVSPAIDNTLADDTVYTTLVVNPELTVNATAVTGGNGMTNCIVAGSKVAQVVNIANSGNMDMEDLVLTLSVNNESGVVVETITDTIFGTFAVNATVNHTFASTYTVPTGGELYNVQVVVAPSCNAAMDFDDIITECVDLSDIEIVAILAPDASSTDCDAIGSTIKVKAQLRNNHPNDDYQNIVIHAEVTANSGASLGSWTETINEIQAGSTLDFEFPQGFAVPNEVNYTVKVYVNNMDGNAGNDTLSATKCTDLGIGEGDVNGISMSQNIPNPAETNARVQYSVPTSGQVVFTLTTVTGQIIYSESVNVESGVHYIDFNTVNLANGIYFYTMDFNGQRLVKKMSVRN